MVTNTTKTSPKAKTKTSPKAPTKSSPKSSPKLTKVSKSSISKPKKGFPKFLNNLKEILLSFQFHICFQISVGIFVIVMLIIFIIKTANNKNGTKDKAENFLVEGFKTDTLNRVYESYESEDYDNYIPLRFAFINTILLFSSILLFCYDDLKLGEVSLSFLSQALFIVFAVIAITTPTGKYNNMNYDNSTRISYTTFTLILPLILLSLFLRDRLSKINGPKNNEKCVEQLHDSRDNKQQLIVINK